MRCHPAVKSIVEACRCLRADALAIELPEHAIVAVVNAYDDTYTTAICDPGALLSPIVRGLQVRLYSGQSVKSYTAFLPASEVVSALSCWEGQIALVFGRPYAAKLVSGTVAGQDRGRMTISDLEAIRHQLSASVGGCIKLKVEK